MSCIEEASGQPLVEWSRLWLETPSVNTLSVDWQADGGHLSEMRMHQAASEEYPTLRPRNRDRPWL